MTIAFVAIGGHTSVTAAPTALDPSTPAGLSPSDICILQVQVKGTSAGVAPTIATPAGWTLIGAVTNNGTLVAGTDTGSNTVAMFAKVGEPSSTAIGTLTITGADSGGARITAWSTTLGAWDVTSTTTGSDTASGANFSATGAAGLDLAAGDWVLYAAGVSGDIGTVTAQALTGMAGATMGTFTGRSNIAVTAGTDSRSLGGDKDVVSGTSNAAPVFTFTNASVSTGHVRFVRLREVAPDTALIRPTLVIPQAAVIRAATR